MNREGPIRQSRRILGQFVAIAALALAWVPAVCALDGRSAEESRRVELVARLEKSVVLVKIEGRGIVHEKEGISLEPSGSLGTGVVLAADGLVLTAAHLVADAELIRVRLLDGTERAARVVFSDDGADLALLRTESPPAGLVAARETHSRASPRSITRLAAAIFLLAALHAAVSVSTHSSHVIHVILGGLYLLPIIAGALWFGLRGGVLAALVVSVAYLAHIWISWSGQTMENVNQFATRWENGAKASPISRVFGRLPRSSRPLSRRNSKLMHLHHCH